MNSTRERVAARLREYPVMASAIGAAAVGEPALGVLLGSPAPMVLLGGVPITALPRALRDLRAGGKEVFVNLDTTPGLDHDRSALDFLRALGAFGVVTTRVLTVERARASRFPVIQKVFLPDRSTLDRSVRSIGTGRPDLVLLQPAPILARMAPEVIARMGPFLAAGFVHHPADIADALAAGALGVSTSTVVLWGVTRSQLDRREEIA